MRILVAFGKNTEPEIVNKLMASLSAELPGDEVVAAGDEWRRVKSNTNNLLAMYRQKLFAGGGAFHPTNDFQAWPHFCAHAMLGTGPRFGGVVIPVDVATAINVNGVPAVEFGRTTLDIVAAFGVVGKEIRVAYHSRGQLVAVEEGHVGDFLTYGGVPNFETAGCLLIPGKAPVAEDGSEDEQMAETTLDDFSGFIAED